MDNIDEEGSNLGFKCIGCILLLMSIIIILLHELL